MRRKFERKLDAEKIAKEYDIDRMISDCEAHKSDKDVIAFCVGVGRILPKFGFAKQQKEALEFIKDLDGFLGVHPIDVWRNLLIFDSLNNAKAGKNLMTAKGIHTGTYIVPIVIPREYANKNE